MEGVNVKPAARPARGVILVGATGGRGRAAAEHLAGLPDGPALLLVGRDRGELLALSDCCNAVREGAATWRVWGDVGLSPDASLRAAVSRMPQPSALVYLPGVLGGPGPRLHEADLSAWQYAVDINLFGAARACQLALPAMLAGGRGGHVVLLSGGGACEGRPGYSAYAASKAAVVRLAETIALEYAADGIEAYAVAPGPVGGSRMLADCLAAGDEPPRPERTTSPREFAALLWRLLSEDASGLSGRLVHVRDDWAAGEGLPPGRWKLRRQL